MTDLATISDDDIIARADAIRRDREASAAAAKQAAAADMASLVTAAHFQATFAEAYAIHSKDTLDLQTAYLLSTMRELAKRSGVTLAA